jgi:hypothetical protein
MRRRSALVRRRTLARAHVGLDCSTDRWTDRHGRLSTNTVWLPDRMQHGLSGKARRVFVHPLGIYGVIRIGIPRLSQYGAVCFLPCALEAASLLASLARTRNPRAFVTKSSDLRSWSDRDLESMLLICFSNQCSLLYCSFFLFSLRLFLYTDYDTVVHVGVEVLKYGLSSLSGRQ